MSKKLKHGIFIKLQNNWEIKKRFGFFRFAVTIALNAVNKFCYLKISQLFLLTHNDNREFRLTDRELEVRRLNHEEVFWLGRDAKYPLEISEAEKLIKRGDRCYGVIVDGQVANYRWYTSEVIPQDHAGVGLSFPKNFVYAYKGFTLADYRGRGFHGISGLKAASDLSSGGIDIISLVNFTNWAIKRSLRKRQAKNHGYIYDIRILGHVIKVVSKGIKRIRIQYY